MTEHKSGWGGHKLPPIIITLCGLFVTTIGLALYFGSGVGQQTERLQTTLVGAPAPNSDQSHLPAQGILSKGGNRNVKRPSMREAISQESKTVGKGQIDAQLTAGEAHNQRFEIPPTKIVTKSPPVPGIRDQRGGMQLVPPHRTSAERPEILRFIDKIPPLTEIPPADHIRRMALVNTSVENTVRRLRKDIGVEINFESAPGELKLLNTMMQDVTTEEVLRHLVENDRRYELLRSRSGWTLRRKNSPLSRINRYFHVSDMSVEEAFGRIVEQIQENAGGDFQVGYGYKGMPPPQNKVNLSLHGNAYDALDALVESVSGLGWQVLWRGDRAWVAVVHPSERGATKPTSLTIVGSK